MVASACNRKRVEAMHATKTKPYNIDKRLVYDAYKAVNKRYAGRKIQAGQLIESIAIKRPKLFVHWRQGKVGAFA